MPVRITCPACDASYAVDNELRGRRIRCRECGKPVSVPAAKAAMTEVVEATAITEEPELVTTAVGPTRRSRHRDEEAEEAPAPKKAGGLSCGAMLLAIGSVGALALVLLVVVGGVIAYVVWPQSPQKSTANNPPNNVPFVPVDEVQRPQQPPPDADTELPGEVTHDISRDFAGTTKDQALDPAVGIGVQLDPKVLSKVKRATVYIRVTMANGGVASGSGFFTAEPGLVVTNAHVLNMLDPGNPPPKKVEVVYQSGEPDSRTFIGQIVGVDRGSDLGILRIQGKDLPEPLTVKNSAGLLETQTVYVVGFPLGENLGTNITVSQTSISSLRKSATGEMTQVQVNGGMHQGNSGGPVVTASGEVIGVAVAIIKGTQINFAVPGELVHMVLNGRLTTIKGGGTFMDGNQVKMRVGVHLADPLHRLQKVQLTWWTGNTGAARPATSDAPVAVAGDSEHKVVDLAVKADEAQCDLVVPADLKPGQLIWLQPVVFNKAGTPRWGSALPFVTAMPPEKLPALLALKPMWGARPVSFSSNAEFIVVQPGLSTYSDSLGMAGVVTESMTAEQNNIATLRWRYQQFTPTWPKGLPQDQMDVIKRALPHIPSLHADLIVDQTNKFDSDDTDVTSSKAPEPTKRKLAEIHTQMQKSLDLLVLALPGKQCQAGETWNADRLLYLPYVQQAGQVAPVNIIYTYRGVRQRDGRPEAVISIYGQFSNFAGKTATGKVKGMGYLDLTSQQISQANVSAVFELNEMGSKVTFKVSSKMDRMLGKELLNIRDQLTATESLKKHTVTLEAGKPCVISLESFKGAGWFDTFVRVEDKDGKTLMQDDNKGVDLNALLVFTPPQSGLYRIVATSRQPATGNYLLVVRQ
jgi:predicted Zn finger-like uncharacterized protein